MNEYTAEMAHVAVARGAAWLDERCPNWPAEIDLAQLKLDDSDDCILGQTADCILGDRDDYVDGYSRVLSVEAADDDETAWAIYLGFDVPLYGFITIVEQRARYEMLTIAWKEYIRERLAAGAPA